MPDQHEPAVVADDLRKRYGDLWALSGASFTVAHGECFALLGPNGAGKTTMTEVLEGYRQRDGGTAAVLGVDPATGDRGWRSRIGVVLQSVRDLGDVTVAEAVRHFAAYYPDPRDPDEVIAAVGLTAKAGTRNGRLSGGQRRRLDVALGIVGRPAVLFLDEPTTGFDPEARRDFWDLIDALKAEGTTILLTTHYLEEAERLADRVAVIARGRVLACDTPARLGGREDGAAVVSWQGDGRVEQVRTAEPTRFVGELAARFDGEVPGLAVTRPGLEDVYLELIRADEAQSPGGTTPATPEAAR